MIAPVWVSGTELAARAMPKSVIFTSPVGRDQDVARLHVAVDHARVVRGLQPERSLPDEVHGAARVERALPADQRGERLAGHVLHHQERAARLARLPGVALAEVVDGGDVGVREVGRVPGLGPEALQEHRVVGVRPPQDLDRDLAAEHVVLAAPHLPHAAAGDPLEEPVAVAQDLVRREGHRCSTASMTARAIGAASWLPLTSAAPPPSSSTTATATCASVSDGAKDTNQACGLRPVALLGGAGLAGHLDAGDLGVGAGAGVDDLGHHLRELRGGLRAHGRADLARAGAVDDGQVGCLHLLHEVGRHQDPAVGHRGRHHRHLQRRRPHVELADRGLRGLRLVGVLGEVARDAAHRDLERLVEAELLGLLAQGVVAELEADLAEGRVAGEHQRLGQRRAAAVARPAVEVRQRHVGLRQVQLGAAVDRRVRVVAPALQGGGRRHDLEGGARRVGLAQRAVEHRS